MRNLFLTVAASLLLAGCLSNQDLPGVKPKIATAEAARHLATPAVISDCAGRVAREVPTAKVTGPFALSARAAANFNDIEELGPIDNIVAIVAPVSDMAPGRLGELSLAGCSYRLQNGGLMLRKVYGPDAFRRYRFVR